MVDRTLHRKLYERSLEYIDKPGKF